jgi:hypothetical protein
MCRKHFRRTAPHAGELLLDSDGGGEMIGKRAHKARVGDSVGKLGKIAVVADAVSAHAANEQAGGVRPTGAVTTRQPSSRLCRAHGTARRARRHSGVR